VNRRSLTATFRSWTFGARTVVVVAADDVVVHDAPWPQCSVSASDVPVLQAASSTRQAVNRYPDLACRRVTG